MLIECTGFDRRRRLDSAITMRQPGISDTQTFESAGPAEGRTEPGHPVIGYCAWMKCSTFTLTSGPKFGIAVEVSVSVTRS